MTKKKKSLRILSLICSPLMHSIKFNVKSQVSALLFYFLFKYSMKLLFLHIHVISTSFIVFFNGKKTRAWKKVCFRSELRKANMTNNRFWVEVTEIVYFSFLMSFSDYLSLCFRLVYYFSTSDSLLMACVHICRIFKSFYVRSSHVLEWFLSLFHALYESRFS